MRINFNVPPYTGKEFDYIKECVENQKICGDGPYTAKDNEWIEKKTGVTKALLNPLLPGNGRHSFSVFQRRNRGKC